MYIFYNFPASNYSLHSKHKDVKKTKQRCKRFNSCFAYRIYHLPFSKTPLFLYNLSELTVWINRNKRNTGSNDFFRLTRNYHERLNGFAFIADKYQLENKPVSYFEFGVASGVSFEWWLQHAKHADSKFFGFDTFEGLPEDWGLFFKKGAMAHDMKAIADERHHFVKVFSRTLCAIL